MSIQTKFISPSNTTFNLQNEIRRIINDDNIQNLRSLYHSGKINKDEVKKRIDGIDRNTLSKIFPPYMEKELKPGYTVSMAVFAWILAATLGYLIITKMFKKTDKEEKKTDKTVKNILGE